MRFEKHLGLTCRSSTWKRIDELEEQTKEQERSIMKAKSDLKAAHNQMASDKEVKYYLDENYSRISQELK